MRKLPAREQLGIIEDVGVDYLKKATEDQTPIYPSFALAEIADRQQPAGSSPAPRTTIKDEMVGGIGGVGGQFNLASPMPPPMGNPMVPQMNSPMALQMNPQMAPPMGFAGGGLIPRYSNGGLAEEEEEPGFLDKYGDAIDTGLGIAEGAALTTALFPSIVTKGLGMGGSALARGARGLLGAMRNPRGAGRSAMDSLGRRRLTREGVNPDIGQVAMMGGASPLISQAGRREARDLAVRGARIGGGLTAGGALLGRAFSGDEEGSEVGGSRLTPEQIDALMNRNRSQRVDDTEDITLDDLGTYQEEIQSVMNQGPNLAGVASSLVPGTRMAGVLDAIGAAQQDKNRRQLEAAIAGGRLAVQEQQADATIARQEAYDIYRDRSADLNAMKALEDAVNDQLKQEGLFHGEEREERKRELMGQLAPLYRANVPQVRRSGMITTAASGGLIRGTVG
jgi:hypothetical protein